MPWPMGATALNTSITPSAAMVTVTFSSKALPPVHSKNVASPKPRHLPRALEAASRWAKPSHCASARPLSMMCSNAPTS